MANIYQFRKIRICFAVRERGVGMKIYYHYFEDKKYNGWFKGTYKKFLGHIVIKIKIFKLFTIYKSKEIPK